MGLDYTGEDVTVPSRMDLYPEEKRSIGKYAAQYIQREDFVYLDAGTTVNAMVSYLKETGATYVTNGIANAKQLAQKGCKVLLLEGRFKATTEALVGVEAVKSLEKYNFTKGFFGANGVDKEHGYTTPDESEAAVKETAMRHCRQRYVLADSSKIGKISPVKFSEFADACVITTKIMDETLKKEKNIIEVRKT